MLLLTRSKLGHLSKKLVQNYLPIVVDANEVQLITYAINVREKGQ
jgi:hypothetical protein